MDERQQNHTYMTKTEFMLIGSWQKLNTLTASPVLSINDTPVNQVSTSKSQGVLIDANLTWGSHIEKLAKKFASGIAASNVSGNLFPQQRCILSTKPWLSRISTIPMLFGEAVA